jgi:hypothetical protein
MSKNTQTATVTIANGGTTTPTLTLDQNKIPLALDMPAAFTGTSISFRASAQANGALDPLYYESTLYSVTVGPSRFISLNRAAFEGVKYLQIVSNAGSGESAARDIVLVSGE